MFSTQDSVDFGPSVLSVGYPQESASPVRKKGRSKHFLREHGSHKSDTTANPFGFSQDSVGPSQYSQNFTDRMGQLNMFCSQENSNISSSESAFSVPFMAHQNASSATHDNAQSNARQSNLSLSKFGSSNNFLTGGSNRDLNTLNNPNHASTEQISTTSSANFESERPIDIAPPVKNTFLVGARPHSEMYMNPVEPPTKKLRPTKVWIGAFKERPRIVTEFEEVRLLGEGTFSTVICARHRLDGTLFAVKRIRESIVSERQGHTLLREVNALAALQGCAQVVKYHSCWIDNHHLFIQTELCHLGSLEDLISPTPNHSSIIYTANMAKTFFMNGGHSGGVSKVGGRVSYHERNRSESFNSIDLKDYDELIQDEYLTAPGPPTSSTSGGGGIGNPLFGELHTPHASQQPPSGLFFSQPTTTTLPNTLHSNTTATTTTTHTTYTNNMYNTQYTQNSISQSSNQFMDDGSMYHTQDGPPNANTASNNINTHTNTSGGSRGVCEDLAWLLLFEISSALKYMHDREMVHLDLRPANIFLTSAPSYNTMDSLDPQRLVHCSVVNSSGSASGTNSTGGGSNGIASSGVPLFAHILNAAPLHTLHSGGTNHTSGLFSRSSTENSTTNTTTTNNTTTNTTITSQYTPAEAQGYDVRTHVERLLVNRQYIVKIGDLGHCCRIDEKSQFQEGQTRYLARELINMEEGTFDAYKADIFSLGATVYELCLGRYLGAEGEEGIAEWHSIRDGSLDPSMWNRYSKPLVDMLHLLTHPDPQVRPSAHTLCSSLLRQHYPGDRASTVFNTANNTNTGTSDVLSELERLKEENRLLKAQLGMQE